VLNLTPLEKLLTVEQLSELIQINRSTLYEWTHAGFMPYYKFPNGVRFKEKDIDDWLKKRQKRGRNSFRILI
jgi:excisionase family DNA binding protein